MQPPERDMTCASPGEQSSVVADLARSDPVMDRAGAGEVEPDAREKGDDTGEELTDKSDADEWPEEEEVHEELFVKSERIVSSTDEVVIPQNLPDPERQRDTPPVEAGLAEEALVQRVAVEDGEELREDGFTVIRRVTTLYHVRTELISGGDSSPRRRMERVLGTEVEEQITELAPNVHLPYDDDAEVETSWDETEDCLPDGTWVKKKTTTTSVRPPPEGTTSFEVISTTSVYHTINSPYLPSISLQKELVLKPPTPGSAHHRKPRDFDYPFS